MPSPLLVIKAMDRPLTELMNQLKELRGHWYEYELYNNGEEKYDKKKARMKEVVGEMRTQLEYLEQLIVTFENAYWPEGKKSV